MHFVSLYFGESIQNKLNLSEVFSKTEKLLNLNKNWRFGTFSVLFFYREERQIIWSKYGLYQVFFPLDLFFLNAKQNHDENINFVSKVVTLGLGSDGVSESSTYQHSGHCRNLEGFSE